MLSLSHSQVSTVEAAAWFQANWVSNLVVDADLRTRAVNGAYERATAHPRDALVGRILFDVFPDNPANPQANGVANLAASMDLVFRRGVRDWMGVQRHDIPDLQRPGLDRSRHSLTRPDGGSACPLPPHRPPAAPFR